MNKPPASAGQSGSPATSGPAAKQRPAAKPRPGAGSVPDAKPAEGARPKPAASKPTSAAKPAANPKPGAANPKPGAAKAKPGTARPGSAGRLAAARNPAAAPTAAPVEPPRSVQNAVRLMYAGAVVTAIGVLISVIAVATDHHALRASHPHATAAQLHSLQSAYITLAILSGLLEIAAWLVMARANRAGVKWARIVASVLFALGTFNFANTSLGEITIGNVAYSAVNWLIGLAAIIFLWQKDARRYFAA